MKTVKKIKIYYLNDCIMTYNTDDYSIDYENRTIEINKLGKNEFLTCEETETNIYVRVK